MILVTGGAGFIGSNLAAALAERGAAVAVCDFLPGADKARNLARLPLRAYIAPQELSGWLAGQAAQLQVVVHLGAITATTETNAELITAVNVRLSQQLWQWCAAAGTRFIYASSAATYGSGSYGFDDDGSPAALARLEPLNLYGSSKHAFDLWVAGELAAGAPHPPQWAGLKFFNVYGPNEYHKGDMRSVVALKYPLVAAGQPVTLFRSHRAGVPDGGQKRDFIYVRDCVAVMLWLLEHPRVSGLFNLGTGQARSFAELAAALCTALERTPRIEYVDTPPELRTHYQYFTEARMERLRSAGYAAPFTSLEDGVCDYVRRYLAQPDPYR
ncbi:MAG: ADP-glyceromanno-heptose 6-epimerase [Gammaproteobacteria bacterium]|nr:ADP-glyceromanno-heptose 6-epimerase [Gammaproteobacteria bacterium]